MSQMIDDLKAIPGVIGAYTWNASRGLQISNLPTLFKTARLEEIAYILTQIHTAGRQNFPDLGDTLICFEEAAALCRQLKQGDFLLMICDSSINMNLLTMSLNLAVETYDSTETAEVRGNTNDERAPTPEQLKKLQTSGPLAKPLQIMSSELFTVMGPMASIVFEEVLLEWVTSERPSPSRLPALLDDLCRETSDPERSRHYRQLVRSRLGEKSND